METSCIDDSAIRGKVFTKITQITCYITLPKGKGGTRFIQPQFVKEIQKQIKNYKIFKVLMDEWKTTAMELTKTKMKEQKESK